MEGQPAPSLSVLPTPQHQTLRLLINQHEQQWLGRTDVRVAVSSGQQQVGLHCSQLEVLQVLVDGTPAQFTLRQQALEPLPEPSVQDVLSGSSRPTLVAEYAYSSYAGLMLKEQEPELLIQLPVAEVPTPPPSAAAAAAGGGAGAAASDGAPLPFGADGAPAAASQPADAPEPPAASVTTAAASTSAATEGVRRSVTPAPAGAAPAAGAADTPASQATQAGAAAAAAAAGASSSRVVTITVTFRKPQYDSSILQQENYLVAVQQLRRARALFPCIDGPVYSYSSTAPFQYACSWDLHITVDAAMVAVASGTLVGTSLTRSSSNTSSNGSAHSTTGAGSTGSSKTFHYRIDLPTHAGNICLAVGPFSITPAVSLLSKQQDKAQQAAAAAALAGTVTTVFHPGPPAGAGVAAGKRTTASKIAAAAAPAAAAGDASGVTCTHQQLAATLRLLPVLLRLYDRLLGGRLPWSQLQLAVVPAGCLMGRVQAGLGCVLLSSDLLLLEDLLDPVPATLAALAAGLAHQYFGCWLVAKGPEDTWLVDALVGWLQGAALKAVMGAAELAWQRWQERQLLVEVDDGAQLAPLCQRPRPHVVGLARTWGLMFGTQALEPCPVAAWKAVAVLSMLERRIGEGELSNVVQSLVGAARTVATTPASTATPSQPPQPARQQVPGLPRERLLDGTRFLRLVGKKEGFKKEMAGFAERWLFGAGVPHLEAALRWELERSTLQLALRQHGPASVIKAARRAQALGSSGDTPSCLLKVEVRELDSVEETLVQLGPEEPLVLQELKVHGSLGLKRKQRMDALNKRRPGMILNENQLLDIPDSDLRGVPVMWVQLDPQGQWLAGVRLRLPLNMWQLLFTHHKDVQAQAAAVASVAQLPPSEPQALLLARVLADSELFCRVRAAAAVALGATATDAGQVQGANLLMRFFREHCYDPATGLLRPNNFSDVAQHWVLQAVPAGLALVRDAEGYTPGHVLSLLLDVVRHNDNDFNPYDDTCWLAAWVTALGDTRPSSPAELQRVLGELDRQLAREAVIGSWQQQVGAACLKALAQLAVTHSSNFTQQAGQEPGGSQQQQPALGWECNGHQQQQGGEDLWMDVDTEGVAGQQQNQGQEQDQDQEQQQQQNGNAQPLPGHQRQQQQVVKAGALQGVQRLLHQYLSPQHTHHLQKAAVSGLLLLARAPGASATAAPVSVTELGQGEPRQQQSDQEAQVQQEAQAAPSESDPAGEQLVRTALQLLTQLPSLQLQLHVLTEALDRLTQAEEQAAPSPGGSSGGGITTRRAVQQQLQASLEGRGTGVPLVTPHTALALHQLLRRVAEVPALRHVAFMLLQRALGQAPTLYRESEEDEDELLPTVNTLTVSNRTGAPQGTAPGAAPSGGRAPSQQPPRPQQSLSRPAGSVGAGPSNLSGGGKTATTALGKFKLSLNKKLAGAKPAGGAASGGGVPASSAGGAAAGSGGVAGPSAAAAATASEGAPAAVAAGVDGDQGGEAPGGGGGAAGGADSTPGRHRLAVSQGAVDAEATGPAAEAAPPAGLMPGGGAASIAELDGAFHSAADAAAAAVAAEGASEQNQAGQGTGGVLGKRGADSAPSPDNPAAKRQQRMSGAAEPVGDVPAAGVALAAAASAAGAASDAAAAVQSLLGTASSAMPSVSGVTAVGSTLTGAKMGKFKFKMKQTGGAGSAAPAAPSEAVPPLPPPAASVQPEEPTEAPAAAPEQQQQQQPAPPAAEGAGARGAKGSRKLRVPKRPGST